MLFTTVVTAVAPSDFTEAHAPCPFPVYLDRCRLSVAGPVINFFPLLSACSPRTFIITFLLISLIFFPPLGSNSFIPHAMENCFMVLFKKRLSCCVSVDLRSSAPRIMFASYPASSLSFPCFFSHTCTHCAAVFVIESDSCLDIYET